MAAVILVSVVVVNLVAIAADARRAGISKKAAPHTPRHAFITTALDAGVPLRNVQEAASHADPRTTMSIEGPAPRSPL